MLIYLSLIVIFLFFTVIFTIILNLGIFKKTNRLMENSGGLIEWSKKTMELILENPDDYVAKKSLVNICLIFGIIGFYLGATFFKNITAGLITGFILLSIPEQIVNRLMVYKNNKITEQLGTGVRLFTSEYRDTPHTMKTIETISTKINDPLGKVFRIASREFSSGIPKEVVLTNMSKRLRTPYGLFFVQLLRQSFEDSTANNMLIRLGARLTTQKELIQQNNKNTISNKVMITILNLLLIPAFVVICKVIPESYEFFTETITGNMLIVIALLSAAGSFLLDRVVNSEDNTEYSIIDMLKREVIKFINKGDTNQKTSNSNLIYGPIIGATLALLISWGDISCINYVMAFSIIGLLIGIFVRKSIKKSKENRLRFELAVLYEVVDFYTTAGYSIAQSLELGSHILPNLRSVIEKVLELYPQGYYKALQILTEEIPLKESEILVYILSYMEEMGVERGRPAIEEEARQLELIRKTASEMQIMNKPLYYTIYRLMPVISLGGILLGPLLHRIVVLVDVMLEGF